MSKPRYRLAKIEDTTSIFAVLEEVACEIPLKLMGDNRRTLVLKLIQECCYSRKSWIAVIGTDIVGFLLVKPRVRRKYLNEDRESEPAGLELSYGGVSKSSRGRRIFPVMVERTMRRRVPLYATVHHDNKGDMKSRLLRLGFIQIDTDQDLRQDHFKWLP
jgi:hypothetical protein